jgi:hypothetical protein
MNRTQVKHLLARMQQMSMLKAPRPVSYDDKEKVYGIPMVDLIAGIKSGKIVAAPPAPYTNEHNFTSTNHLCYKEDFKGLTAERASYLKLQQYNSKASEEIARIEDALIFDNNADAAEMLVTFEKSLTKFAK